VEAVRVIFPTADLSFFLWKDVAATGAAIIVPMETPLGQKLSEWICHPN